MTISGMTGFARTDGAFAGRSWLWEVRSVNGRSLDVKLRVPPGFEALEGSARELAGARMKRGSVSASLSFARAPDAAPALVIDTKLVERLLDAGAPFVAAGRAAPPTWDGLLAVRGVVTFEENQAPDPEARAALDAALCASLDDAFATLHEARLAEGRMLHAALSALFDRLAALTEAARADAAAAPAALAARISARLAALAPDLAIDPARLAQEAAIAASRADVAEELERLAAHGAEARALLSTGEAVGRRLDFLCQELAREANTLCAKASEISLTRIGVDLKTAIDQIKEQGANVE